MEVKCVAADGADPVIQAQTVRQLGEGDEEGGVGERRPWSPWSSEVSSVVLAAGDCVRGGEEANGEKRRSFVVFARVRGSS